jgi:hypothetical protein
MIGDEAVNQAVLAVFAALLWHSQSCREDLEKFSRSFYWHLFVMLESLQFECVKQEKRMSSLIQSDIYFVRLNSKCGMLI